jgi:ribose/xylose/arabinose/galactoside ABC-type transport system permease subunit
MTAELIDEVVARLRSGATVDDLALVVLKISYLLTTLSTMSQANGIAVPVTVGPAVDGLRSWFLLIKEAQSIGSDG